MTTEVDEEILNLYEKNRNNKIVPSIPNDYFSQNGYKYEMSAKEYTKFKKTYGQTAYKNLEKLFKTSEYKEATDEEKEDMIEDVYDNAMEEAKANYGINAKELIGKYGEEEASMRLMGAKQTDKYNEIKGEIDITLEGYWKTYNIQKDVKGDPDKDGKTKSGTEKKNKIKAIREALPNISYADACDLYDLWN